LKQKAKKAPWRNLLLGSPTLFSFAPGDGLFALPDLFKVHGLWENREN
jgi:hypothetical protein